MKCLFCQRKIYTPGEWRAHMRTMHVEEMIAYVERHQNE